MYMLFLTVLINYYTCLRFCVQLLSAGQPLGDVVDGSDVICIHGMAQPAKTSMLASCNSDHHDYYDH